MRAPRLTASLDESPAVRLATAGAVARRELERACKGRGRPLREVLVLVAIQERPGIAPGALADRLGLQRSEISRLVHELHYEGWLEVKRNPYASRGLVITPVGGEAIARAGRAALHSVDRRLRLNLSRLRQQQLEVCLELLKGPRTPVADALSGL